MSIWRWQKWLPSIPSQFQITLGEGDTPLVRSRRIGPALGLPELYFKLESCNPSGSYKDRFGVCAISDMLANNKTRCLATSSGNTGAALAAACAAADIECRIAIVETAPSGKLSQMLAYGAQLFKVKGFGLDPQVSGLVFETLKRLGSAPDAAIQISAYHYSPVGMAGVQSISYELAEQAPGPVDHVFCQAGGGGLTLAVARGFETMAAAGTLAWRPRIECVQPAGNDTIATPLREGSDKARTVQCTSQISGLQVPTVIDGDQVVAACRASGGNGHVVEDDEVWQAQTLLAREEGIFCEPAGAVTLAGLMRSLCEGHVNRNARVVCLVTGSGFKDPPSVERMNREAQCPLISLDELQRM